MSLPKLINWDDTRTALHQAMQPLRAARLLGVEPMPNYLHHSSLPTPTGATTGPLNFGGSLQLDYTQAAVIYTKAGNAVFRVELEGHNQTSLFDAVFDEFARLGHTLDPNRSEVNHNTPFNLDIQQARAYADVQFRMFLVMARLKARMIGPQTPIALWPHGYDLSTLWFVDGMDEHQDPHINIGFSPGTPDVGQPYFYLYAWPLPDGLGDNIPAPLQWHTEWGTPGALLLYDRLVDESDPESVAIDLLSDVYLRAADLLKARRD